MDFVDKTLVRLANPATRAGVFDATALEQLAVAAYDTDAMPVQGPFSPQFDDFRLGYAVDRIGTAEGVWAQVGSAEKIEAYFRLSGIGESAAIRVDALWRGQIIARMTPATGRVLDVTTAWPDAAGIDAEIEAALGGLPTDPVVLEQERRTRFLARIRAALDQPAAFTEACFDDWLTSIGAESVGDLLEHFQGVVHGGAVQVRFSPPSASPPTPKPLPIAAALLIRDTGFSVAQLLMESKMVREQLLAQGVERPRDPALRPRQAVLVAWVIPLAVFDDADWPGGTTGNADARRAARRAAAGAWLAREGIGLVALA